MGIQSPKLVVVKKKKEKKKEITLRHFKLQVWCVHGWVIALVRSHIRQRNVEARGVWDNVLVSFRAVCSSSHAGTGSSMFFVPMCFFFFFSHKNSNLLFDWKVSKFVHMKVQRILQFKSCFRLPTYWKMKHFGFFFDRELQLKVLEVYFCLHF